jgi:DUF1365 family protein
VEHAFRYPLFQLYLDLDELPELFDGRWLWSARGPNVAWFRRADHLGPRDVPLATAVRDLVERETGRRPEGAVRLLTHLRYFGYVINPVSFYWCHDREGAVEAVVAEVHNTPWGERHCYVLDARGASPDGTFRVRTRKAMHVSPFLDMDYDYRFRIGTPGERLTVGIENDRDGTRAFDASLVLQRREIDGRSLAGVLARHPVQTLEVVAAIYWQAFRLWRKRVPFHPHPEGRA